MAAPQPALSLLIPKPEPLDISISPPLPLSLPNPNSLLPNPNSLLTNPNALLPNPNAHLPNPNSLLPNPNSSSHLLDPIMSEYLRLANQFALTFGAQHPELTSQLTSPSRPKRKRQRDADVMVRVPDLTPLDYIRYRQKVRQTRLTYHSFRSLFHLQYLSATSSSDLKTLTATSSSPNPKTLTATSSPKQSKSNPKTLLTATSSPNQSNSNSNPKKTLNSNPKTDQPFTSIPNHSTTNSNPKTLTPTSPPNPPNPNPKPSHPDPDPNPNPKPSHPDPDPNPNPKPNSRSSKPRNRADLKASKKMRQLGLYLHTDRSVRIVGGIPGVRVGDVFFYRAELMVLGVHNQIQGGIGYVPAELVREGVPICTSIVASGGYQDDEELSDDVIMYTGSGGRVKNQTHVTSDQSLQRGNLSLERSMQFGIEIRVIRGLTINSNPLKKVYIYDGLYRVIECKKDKGKSGCHVYLFKLVRVRGQTESGTRSIRISEEIKKKLKENIVPSGYVSVDISQGVESVPVPFFNDIDEEKYPLMFEYVKSPNYPSLVKPFKGCQCESACSVNCACVKRNNGQLAYDSNGNLTRGRPIVYECGDTCRCPIGCPNRVTQNGVKLQLEVFRSSGNIWGVRSLDLIQAGSFICEFSGDLVEANSDPNPNRVLIDPKSFPQRWREFGDVSSHFPGLIKDPDLAKEPEYLLDVSRRRNVACYISHSASPNLFVQYVLYGHDSAKYPRVMIFAMENIPPLRELSLDYGVVE